MTSVRISLDPTSPAHRELEQEILQYVKSLETASYSTVTLPAEPGKLSGIDMQTIIITVELSAAVISFLAAIIDLVNQTLASHQQDHQKRDEKRQQKDVEIFVNDIKISLPVTNETARKNLQKVSISIGETKTQKSLPSIKKPKKAKSKTKSQRK
jgi:hypothetical protein